MITILRDRCLSCGCCVTACRRYIFRMGADDTAEIDPDKLALCMHCGHCAAACPANAVVLDCVPGEKLCELPPSFGNTLASQIDILLMAKRSTGAYAARPVPREVLEAALLTANYAPSARGVHPVKWVIVNTPESRARLLEEMLPFYAQARDKTAGSHYENHLAGKDSLLRDAPCVLVAYAPRHGYAQTDCDIAMTYAALSLHAHGVASCWAGSVLAVAHEQGLPCLAIPDPCQAYAALLVGYPDVNFFRLPYRPDPDITWM